VRVLVTGGAGFIGSHLVDRMLNEGQTVLVLDNFDPFYDKRIKEAHLATHRSNPSFSFVEQDILDRDGVSQTMQQFKPDVIVHLAAKAGVRPSLENPVAYQQVNVQGTQHLLEAAKEHAVTPFIFAGSSSVYGVNPRVPWREDDCVLNPISPYGATKVAGELLGHVYSHLYGIRFISLRFFTVYGPRQRPDLAIHKFARRLLQGEPISLFGDGSTSRDYTFVGDIVQGIRTAMDYTESNYEIINLGNRQTVRLTDLVRHLERTFGLKANVIYKPEQPGDVHQTYANTDKAKRLLGYEPRTGFEEGLLQFRDWLLSKK